MVSTHSRAKAADSPALTPSRTYETFQHTAARRRLNEFLEASKGKHDVSTHSRAKAAEHDSLIAVSSLVVSTHSRAKAADHGLLCGFGFLCCFNTQPREGG